MDNHLLYLKLHRYLQRTAFVPSAELINNPGQIVDERALSPIDCLCKQEKMASLRSAIGRLDGRRRVCTTLYFGLDGEHGRTLQDVGKIVGITREVVRQHIACAIRILQQCWLSKEGT